MPPKLTPVLLLCAFSTLSAPLLADNIPVTLPPALIEQMGFIDHANLMYSESVFGAFSVMGPLSAMTGPVEASSSAFGGNSPSVSSMARIAGNPATYTGTGISSDAAIRYSFEVTSPTDRVAQVNITASGGAEATNPASIADADLEIEADGASVETLAGTDLNVVEHVCVGSESCVGIPDFSVDQTFTAATNVVYTVTISADTHTDQINGAFLVSSFVDPTVQLLPSDNPQDSLIFSPGLGNTTPSPVPEPSSLVLLFTGALGLAESVRRKASR